MYLHKREDNNEVFYVGIGTKPKKYNTHRTEYKRAYDKYTRNKHWKAIVNKYGYNIEIIFESNNYEEINNKEVELIAEYKTIANYTPGGKGATGINGKRNYKSKTIYQFTKEGEFIKEWDSVNLAAGELKIFCTNICVALKGNNKLSGGYRWSYNKDEDFKPLYNGQGKWQISKKGGVIRIDKLTNEITELKSIRDAAKSINTKNTGKISQCCNNKRKSYRGYLWIWKTDYILSQQCHTPAENLM